MDALLKEGDMAPDFSAADDQGRPVSLSDFRGKNVVLFFYPKDNTPGCTKEACGFRDNYEAIERKGAAVLGVSTDSVKSHGKFVGKFELPFRLLADTDKKIVQAYGVYGEKKFMGITYQGTSRVTFLIGGDGRIRKIWSKVKPAEHTQEVIDSL